MVLVVLPALVACGTGADEASLARGRAPTTTSSSAPETSATSTSVVGTPTTTVPGVEPVPTTAAPSLTTRPEETGSSILQRHDALPAGVAAQGGFWSGGAGGADPCKEFPPDTSDPTLVVPGGREPRPDQGTIFVGFGYYVCAHNFRTGPPIRLQITGPLGTVKDETICAPCAAEFHWVLWRSLPGEPVGEYQVVATQADLRLTGAFTVQRQTRPILVVDRNPADTKPIRRGSTVRIGLGGFPPAEPIAIHVYHSPSTNPTSSGRYITSLQVRADVHGEWQDTLVTAADDPPGCYSFQTSPSVDSSLRGALATVNGFCLAYG